MGLDKITRGNFKETNSIMDLGAGLTDLFSLCVCPQSYLTLWDSMAYSPPGSSAHGIFQVRILE